MFNQAIVSSNELYFQYLMVGMEGVEPPRLTALEPKSSVSASSTTSPVDCLFYMTKARIKPKTAKITHIIVSF